MELHSGETACWVWQNSKKSFFAVHCAKLKDLLLMSRLCFVQTMTATPGTAMPKRTMAVPVETRRLILSRGNLWACGRDP